MTAQFGVRTVIIQARPYRGTWVIALVLLLEGCIYVPRTTVIYDQECRIEAKHMTLEMTQVGALGHCQGNQCAQLLVAAGAVTAASAVVSGSIVVTGNIVYWFEKQGRCLMSPWGAGVQSRENSSSGQRTMGELEDLEKRIRSLPPEELAKFRTWFYEFDHVLWDRQIESDSNAGKLDKLAAEALADYKAGKAREV